jgi:hypothetical protein
MTDLDRELEPDVDAEGVADYEEEAIDLTTPEHDHEEDISVSGSELWDDDALSLEDDAVYDDVSARVGDIAACLVDEDSGETVCTALLRIAHQLTVQNRIMIKMLSKLSEE